MPTPLEALIDRACGIENPQDISKWVTLACTECLVEKRVPKDSTDPEKTERIEFICPDCKGSINGPISFFDGWGNPLRFE